MKTCNTCTPKIRFKLNNKRNASKPCEACPPYGSPSPGAELFALTLEEERAREAERYGGKGFEMYIFDLQDPKPDFVRAEYHPRDGSLWVEYKNSANIRLRYIDSKEEIDRKISTGISNSFAIAETTKGGYPSRKFPKDIPFKFKDGESLTEEQALYLIKRFYKGRVEYKIFISEYERARWRNAAGWAAVVREGYISHNNDAPIESYRAN